MNNQEKSKKRQRGFTLVELIVTLAILAIVLVVAGNVLFFGNRMYTQTEVKNSEKYIGDSVFKYMRKEIIYATNLEVQAKDTIASKCTQDMNVKGTNGNVVGHLLVGKVSKEENVLGTDFYNSRTTGYSVAVQDDHRIKLKVSVYDAEGNEVYETEGIIKNLNIPSSSSIAVLGGSIGTEYTNSPVVYFETDIQVDTTFDPLSLYEQMKYTYESYDAAVKAKDLSKLPEGYLDVLKEDNFARYDNDRFRLYINQYYYHKVPYATSEDGASWPDFPGFEESHISNVDKKIKENGGTDAVLLSNFLSTHTSLKVMVRYIKSDNSYYVYVPMGLNEKWALRLIYYHDSDTSDPLNGSWYYYYKTYSGDKFQISNGGGVPWATIKSEIKSGTSSSQGGYWIKVE